MTVGATSVRVFGVSTAKLVDNNWNSPGGGNGGVTIARGDILEVTYSSFDSKWVITNFRQ